MVFTFKVKIVKFGNAGAPYIGIGIIDCEKFVHSANYYGQDYTVAYVCLNAGAGVKYPGGAAEGEG